MTGLTLPGMIDDPAWRMGSFNSLSPQRGPDAMRRKSFAILMRTSAVTFIALDTSAKTSVLFVASMMFVAVMYRSPSACDMACATLPI